MTRGIKLRSVIVMTSFFVAALFASGCVLMRDYQLYRAYNSHDAYVSCLQNSQTQSPDVKASDPCATQRAVYEADLGMAHETTLASPTHTTATVRVEPAP